MAEAVIESTAEQLKKLMKLCTYAEKHGICSLLDGECTALHGDICDLCGNAALHPYNEEKREHHVQECLKVKDRNMERSLAEKQSDGKTCAICFEKIMDKPIKEQVFGILPNCSHCFCLSCIRKWRQAELFSMDALKACPECRTQSEFVCPSKYWVDDNDKLILRNDYLQALVQKRHGKLPVKEETVRAINVMQQLIAWDIMDNLEVHWLHSIGTDFKHLIHYYNLDDSD